MPSEPERDLDAVRLGIDHAWQWFSIHATQRLQMLNFWLVAVAFLTAAYVTALTNKQPQVAAVVAAAAAILSLLFSRLELRTRQLVRLGERALGHFESILADVTGVAEMRILEAADAEKELFASYGIVIRAMQWFVIAAYVGAGGYATWKWAH
jgi:hypothetical protein